MGAINLRKAKYKQLSVRATVQRRILTETVWDNGAMLWDFSTASTSDIDRRMIWDKTVK